MVSEFDRRGASRRRAHSCRSRRIVELVLGCLLLPGLLAWAGHAAAETAADDWRPSLAVSLKAQQQRAEAIITSTLNVDVVSSRDPTPIALDADEHDDYFTVIVPIELQLQTPAFSLPIADLKPRAFVQAAYQWVPITDRDFLTEGKFISLPPAPTAASEGLGGEVRVDLQHQWSLSAGLAFAVEIGGIPIEIRPSVDYVGQWVRADAKAIGVQDVTDQLFSLEDDKSKAVHFFGPRLAVETDAGRWGPTRLTVFAEGSVYFSRLFGSQQLRGSDSDSGETMSFSYEPDNLLFQIGVGTRIYWDPR